MNQKEIAERKMVEDRGGSYADVQGFHGRG